MSARRLFTRRNVLIAGSAAIAAECVGLYIYRANGERRYPARSLTELPRASAIRTLFEEGSEPIAPSYTCTAPQPVRVNPPGRWLPTFVALSYTMPRARLEAYARARLHLPDPPTSATERLDAQTLMHAAATAYFDAIPHRPEVRLGLRPSQVFDPRDGEVPSDARAALRPGYALWDHSFTIFGSWSTKPPSAVDATPVDATVAAGGAYPPPCSMPSNFARARPAGAQETDAAGAVLYWRFDKLTDPKAIEIGDKIASYGYPWRFMVGGFHELIVEDVPERNERGEELVRITYALTEAYDLHPLGKKEDDKKTVPGWTLAFHRDYARSMLHETITQIEKR
ncbi:hypothetical protein AURDEDRAFT_182763 [Auricularia subglabra TFB-10046 SS5]|nr:hypothetical protein AURDEDRAFT_182763 [Auricularia subglabra TFB-10046 SS5]